MGGFLNNNNELVLVGGMRRLMCEREARRGMLAPEILARLIRKPEISTGPPSKASLERAMKITEVYGFEADYKARCIVCDQSPCVVIMKDGEAVHHLNMCGPCTFGEADALDPENW